MRIDDDGIIPEVREQALRFGPRAAEAVREGWLVDSIQRSETEFDDLIDELQVQNRADRDLERQYVEKRRRGGMFTLKLTPDDALLTDRYVNKHGVKSSKE